MIDVPRKSWEGAKELVRAIGSDAIVVRVILTMRTILLWRIGGAEAECELWSEGVVQRSTYVEVLIPPSVVGITDIVGLLLRIGTIGTQITSKLPCTGTEIKGGCDLTLIIDEARTEIIARPRPFDPKAWRDTSPEEVILSFLQDEVQDARISFGFVLSRWRSQDLNLLKVGLWIGAQETEESST